MKIRFLIDEDLPPRLKIALLRENAWIDILRVGDESAPPLGTQDPDILRYTAAEGRLLITNNRKTMAVHAAELLNLGVQHWGVLRRRPYASMGQMIETLHLLWGASEAEEWIGRMEWIPF